LSLGSCRPGSAATSTVQRVKAGKRELTAEPSETLRLSVRRDWYSKIMDSAP
jgi:hypothetical protein